ncbi:hypothetical protein L3X38_018861 [Prunus dulcis]|uniref:CCHC-type domain-containing protein n=1 Tax=Prunus dulcis TaxID=3755 RepID=A0AAD4WBK2_PRUDU|nr:hypothetical protein L3X38_018861 [Prunus dulcis]
MIKPGSEAMLEFIEFAAQNALSSKFFQLKGFRHQHEALEALLLTAERHQGNGTSGYASSSSVSYSRCQICGNNGHQALDCFNRMNMAYEGRVPTRHLSAVASQSNTNPRPNANTWLIDIGANSHITPDLGTLNNPREYNAHFSASQLSNTSSTSSNTPPTPELAVTVSNISTPNTIAQSLAPIIEPQPVSVSPLAVPSCINAGNSEEALLVRMVTRSQTGHLKPNPKYAINSVVDVSKVEPTCFSKAVKQEAWRQAMATEFSALQHCGTWVLVPATSHMNILPNKWVYKIKRKSDGSIERFKALLVANGFH